MICKTTVPEVPPHKHLRHLDCFCTCIGDVAGHWLPMSETWDGW